MIVVVVGPVGEDDDVAVVPDATDAKAPANASGTVVAKEIPVLTAPLLLLPVAVSDTGEEANDDAVDDATGVTEVLVAVAEVAVVAGGAAVGGLGRMGGAGASFGGGGWGTSFACCCVVVVVVVDTTVAVVVEVVGGCGGGRGANCVVVDGTAVVLFRTDLPLAAVVVLVAAAKTSL